MCSEMRSQPLWLRAGSVASVCPRWISNSAAPRRPKSVKGKIRVGVGGWNYQPWRGVFYREGLPQKRELELASRHLTSIEINATYYSGFKPEGFAKWRRNARRIR